MKISTRTRYGARFLLHLARHAGGGAVPLSEVAKQQQISWKYLGSIASRLRSAGLVRTSLGAGGGFSLALAPGRITLLDVFTAFDGPVNLVRCVRDASACGRADGCAARSAWSGVNAAMESALRAVTIAALAARGERGGGTRRVKNGKRRRHARA